MQFHLSLLPVLFCIHLAVGLALLWLGTRRHVRGDQPKCGSCGADARGVANDPEPTCAGCGRKLAASGAVRFPKERLPWATLLAAMAVLAVLPVWPPIYRTAQRPAPVWFRAALPPGPPGWEEISKDAAQGNLSRAQARAHLLRAAREISDGRARDPHWWGPGLFRCIGAMLDAHCITHDDAEPVFKTLLQDQIKVELQPAVRQGRPIPVVAWYYGLEPSEYRYKLQPVCFRKDAATSFPVQRKPTQTSRAYYGLPPYEDSFELRHSLVPGEHDLKLVCDLVLETGGTKFTFGREFPVSVRVAPAAQSAVQLVKDPLLAKSIMQCVQLRDCFVTPGLRQNFLQANWHFIGKPDIPVFYFDVWVVAGSEEYMLGWIANPGVKSGVVLERANCRYPLPAGKIVPANVRTATVRLVPNPERAELLFGASRLPADPIVIPDVPLNRYDLTEFWSTTRPSDAPWRY